MAVAKALLQPLEREEVILSVLPASSELPRLRTGDHLTIVHGAWGAVEIDIVFTRVGQLPLDASQLDIETWDATVADPGQFGFDGVGELKVRLRPFPMKDCGCVVNFGGYIVKRCPADQAVWDATPDLPDRFDEEYPRDLRNEQEAIYREVTT